MNLSEHFSKITEDFRTSLKISEEEPVMFRSYSNKSKGLFNHNSGNLFICENSMLFSLCEDMFTRESSPGIFHWCLYNNTKYVKWSKYRKKRYDTVGK